MFIECHIECRPKAETMPMFPGLTVGFEDSREKKHIPGMPEFRESFRGIPFQIPAPPPKKKN